MVSYMLHASAGIPRVSAGHIFDAKTVSEATATKKGHLGNKVPGSNTPERYQQKKLLLKGRGEYNGKYMTNLTAHP